MKNSTIQTQFGLATCGHAFRFRVGRVPDEVKCAVHDKVVGIWAHMNPKDDPPANYR